MTGQIENSSPIKPEEYITQRVDQYQSWYDKKSVAMKSRYLRMRAFSVVGGGLVPVLANVTQPILYLAPRWSR